MSIIARNPVSKVIRHKIECMEIYSEAEKIIKALHWKSFLISSCGIRSTDFNLIVLVFIQRQIKFFLKLNYMCMS